jgi:hypothetical protein
MPSFISKLNGWLFDVFDLDLIVESDFGSFESADFTQLVQGYHMYMFKKISLFLLLMTIIGWSSISSAGCLAAQTAGVWEAAFSDGNSCRLKLKNNGSVDTQKSVCFDPDRGTTDIDSGEIKVAANCFSEGNIVLSGTAIELPVQFSHDRSMAAGRFRVPANGSKGSVVMIRVP